MNLFILRDGVESGPFSWVDVYIMLKKSELDWDALARNEGETKFKTLECWGLWCEGNEVGPFTWDEISAMLREGVLDLDIQAKLEGASELSILRDVISQSRQIDLAHDEPEQLQANAFSSFQDFLKTLVASPARVQTAVTCIIALILGAALLLYLGNNPKKGVAIEETKTVLTTVEPSPVGSQREPALAQPIVAAPAVVTQEAKSELPSSAQLSKAEPTPPQSIVSPISEIQPAISISSPDQTVPASNNTPPSIIAKGSQNSTTAPASTLSPPQQKQAQTVQPISSTPKPVVSIASSVTDFFKIQSVKLLKKEPKDRTGVWKFSDDKKRKPDPDEFQPCLEVQVAAMDNVRCDKLTAKAYFFDLNNILLVSVQAPSKAGNRSQKNHHPMPELFYKDKPDRIFFEIPEKIRDGKWKAVVVFGDKHEVQSACFPPTESDFLLTYPEKALVYDRTTRRVARTAAMDPLIEYVVKTNNAKHPKITLFLRPPTGISDAKEIKGVIATSLLAGSVDEMKR